MLNTAEIGHFTLALALATALVMALAPLLQAATQNTQFQNQILKIGRIAAHIMLAQITLAFTMLTVAFITSDFSVKLVAQHSHILKPTLYKIAGLWGNHEGSLLLWLLILALFSAAVAAKKNIPHKRKALILASQGTIATAFILFIIITSNPFTRLNPPPLEGNGLNPLLQDIGLALHPPMLYLGYVGLSVAFSFAITALIEGKADKQWAKQARPFILAAWAALTLGIALGSWWAYYELGWGGWWFWDPVENASLMPWLIATALIHSIITVEKRGLFQSWTILLAILGFSLSLLGTFIVRSGLLTSVHAFASDPARGTIILAMLGGAIGSALILFAIRGGHLATHPAHHPHLISREVALVANNLILTTATATVLIGTLYPLALEAWNGARISVGPPFYNATFTPMMMLMILIMAIAPLLAWHKADIKRTAKRMLPAAMLAAAIMTATTALTPNPNITAIATIGLAFWLIASVATDIIVQIGVTQIGSARKNNATIFKRFISIPPARWGMTLAHLGVAVFILGAAGTSFYQTETIVRAFPGDILTAGRKTYRLEKITPLKGPNYTSTAAVLSLLNKNGQAYDTMISEIRFYPTSATTTTEAAIRPRLDGDAYAVLGDGDPQQGYTIRLYDKPIASWIWGGATLMALGGTLAMRREEKPHE